MACASSYPHPNQAIFTLALQFLVLAWLCALLKFALISLLLPGWFCTAVIGLDTGKTIHAHPCRWQSQTLSAEQKIARKNRSHVLPRKSLGTNTRPCKRANNEKAARSASLQRHRAILVMFTSDFLHQRFPCVHQKSVSPYSQVRKWPLPYLCF